MFVMRLFFFLSVLLMAELVFGDFSWKPCHLDGDCDPGQCCMVPIPLRRRYLLNGRSGFCSNLAQENAACSLTNDGACNCNQGLVCKMSTVTLPPRGFIRPFQRVNGVCNREQ